MKGKISSSPGDSQQCVLVSTVTQRWNQIKTENDKCEKKLVSTAKEQTTDTIQYHVQCRDKAAVSKYKA